MSENSIFSVGDAVVVKPGVVCPDAPSLSLAGLQGWVIEVYPEAGTLEFQWDGPTLRSLSADYIRESLIDGLDWESMVLEIDEVLPAAPRDTPAEAKAVYTEIMAQHQWDYLADVNPGISALLAPLGAAGETAYLRAWEEHLRQALHFPFAARREEQFRRGPVAIGAIVTVTGIAHVDDLYGLIAEVQLDRRSYAVPLCDLEATDASSANYQPLNDYVVWYANR